MDEPQKPSSSNSFSDSASVAPGCSTPQHGAGGFVSSLRQKWAVLAIGRAVDRELQDCLAEIQKTNKEIRQAERARLEYHSQWLQEAAGVKHLTTLERLLVEIFNPLSGLDRISSEMAEFASKLRKLVPTEHSRVKSCWDRLKEHQQLVSACEKLIKSAETEERSLKEYADKTTLNAERLARRLERSKEKSDRLIEESGMLNIRAKAAREKWRQFARLQSVRIPMLKSRLEELEAECFRMQLACYKRSANLNAVTEKRIGAVLDSNKLTKSIFERAEERVQAKEDWSAKLTALIKDSEIGIRGIFPDLFKRLEDSVAHSETRAKESSESLAKVPGFALADMSAVQLMNELKILIDIESELKAKRLEVEAFVSAMREEVINSKLNYDYHEEIFLSERREGDEMRVKELQDRLDLYSAQHAEFRNSMKLLEDERTRMDCRIEVVQEECERVRSLLRALSSSSSSSS
jgi:hypothetical protein